jgi:hypothetical protein
MFLYHGVIYSFIRFDPHRSGAAWSSPASDLHRWAAGSSGRPRQGDRPMTKDFPPDDGETRPDPSDLRIATVAVPYTQVHTVVRRLLENLQDVVVSLLLVLLLVLSLQAIWRIGVVALTGPVMTNQVLSEILFVLILTEVYRLLNLLPQRAPGLGVPDGRGGTGEHAPGSDPQGSARIRVAPHRGAQPASGRSGGSAGGGTLDGARAECRLRVRCVVNGQSPRVGTSICTHAWYGWLWSGLQ